MGKNQDAYNTRLRKKALTKLGGKCVCCGLTEWWILTIDHIIPSKEHRGNSALLCRLIIRDLVNLNDFQCLCYGCNNSKNTNEKCKLDHTS